MKPWDANDSSVYFYRRDTAGEGFYEGFKVTGEYMRFLTWFYMLFFILRVPFISIYLRNGKVP